MDAQQFLAEFSHIASAPRGVQRLRQMIYNLAITGDLTRRFAEDGDAESLLRDIERTKAHLIATNEFKRSPKLENQPLLLPVGIKLPASWCWTRLVDIGEISPKNEVADDTLASFIPMSGIPQLHSGKLEAEQRPWSQIKKGFTHFADGDVMLAKITPCFENGKAAVIAGLTNGVGAGTTELHVIRPLQGFVDPAYIYIFLRSPYFVEEGERNMTGTAGQKRLPTEYFATRAFPLPPIAEQMRIVAKVKELMALCDKLEAQQQEHERLHKLTQKTAIDNFAAAQNSDALFKGWDRVRNSISLWLDNEDAVAELRSAVVYMGCRGLLTESTPIDGLESNDTLPPLPAGWSWTTLRQLSDYITSGSRGWRQFMGPHGDIFIRSQDIKYDALVFEDPAFVNLPDRVEGKRTLVRPGDLLITITGANVGKCAQVPELPLKAYVSQHIALVRVLDVRHTPFLHWWITNAYGGRKHLARFIYGDKPGLNLPQVGSIPIPLPPQEAQDRIVEALGRYTAICDQLAAQVKDARNLARLLAVAAVAAIIGISIKDKEKMKPPKTELVSTLRIGISPVNREQAPLAAILIRNQGELPAKALWSNSGLDIEDFYQQLKTEMANGWIVQPEPAYMKEVETA